LIYNVLYSLSDVRLEWEFGINRRGLLAAWEQPACGIPQGDSVCREWARCRVMPSPRGSPSVHASGWASKTRRHPTF